MPRKKSYRLTMTEEETRFLRRLLGHHIVGKGSNRAHLQSIYEKLHDLLPPEPEGVKDFLQVTNCSSPFYNIAQLELGEE